VLRGQELKALLREKGLPVGGTKGDLVDRLLEAHLEEKEAEELEEAEDDAEVEQMMRDELGETSGDLEFYDRNYREKKEALLPNLIIFAVFGMDDDETDETLIYFAEVRSLPPESGPGSQSVKVHWLDEAEGDVRAR
jgi:hypothetical protein